MSLTDDLIYCNGQQTAVYTVDGCMLYGVLCYKPQNGDFSIVVYENGCCEMTILTPSDVCFIDCTGYMPHNNCACV